MVRSTKDCKTEAENLEDGYEIGILPQMVS